MEIELISISNQEPEGSDDVFARRLALWEIASVTSSLLIAEWLLLSVAADNKFIFFVPATLAFLLMLFSHLLRAEGLRDIGVRWDNFGSAMIKLAIPTIVFAIVIVAIGWFVGSLRLSEIGSRPRYLLLPFWALLQQYVMQGFINRRAQIVCGKSWKSILIVGALFGVLHLPNPGFAILTFIASVLWAAIYQRTPNLFAIALSHTALAILVALSLPSAWVNGLRVGFKAFG